MPVPPMPPLRFAPRGGRKEKEMENKWIVEVYQSGTHIVTTHEPKMPWLYVYAPDRLDACRKLADFLNGGKKPEFLPLLYRYNNECVKSKDGKYDIYATGWMVLPENDNGALNWRECQTPEAKQMRKELIDKIDIKVIITGR